MISANVIDSTSSDIRAGLALWMDPGVLVHHGATYVCTFRRRVRGRHRFLCLGTDGGHGRWTPLYSRPCAGRVRLSDVGRRGDLAWVRRPIYCDTTQVWRVPNAAIIAAAQITGDRLSGKVNRLRRQYLPNISPKGRWSAEHFDPHRRGRQTVPVARRIK